MTLKSVKRTFDRVIISKIGSVSSVYSWKLGLCISLAFGLLRRKEPADQLPGQGEKRERGGNGSEKTGYHFAPSG